MHEKVAVRCALLRYKFSKNTWLGKIKTSDNGELHKTQIKWRYVQVRAASPI
jgi:hypothetical protein